MLGIFVIFVNASGVVTTFEYSTFYKVPSSWKSKTVTISELFLVEPKVYAPLSALY